MQWTLKYLDEFTSWLNAQDEGLQDEALARLELLTRVGPLLGRPYVDTLKGSSLPNLKELRFDYQRAPIRILFAFDYKKQAVILLGGDKGGDKRWYETNIPIAEKLFNQHVQKERKADEERKRQEHDKKDKEK